MRPNVMLECLQERFVRVIVQKTAVGIGKMNNTLSQAEIIDYLRQHIEAGCTDMLADAPVDHYAAVETAPPQNIASTPTETETANPAAPPTSAPQNLQKAVAAPTTEPVTAAFSSAEAISDAAELAKNANSLEQLQTAMAGFDGCQLKTTAKNLVFCDGVAGAKIMLIGEAPGQDEDRQGKPFVGRSGQLLDLMLASIGISRADNLYISNVVPWRPPGNRTPSSEEIALCKPFIARHIELAKPDILLLVGNISNKTLLQTETGITKLRGQWQNYQADGLDIPALPLLHPAYVLRRPETKVDFWADLCRLKEKLAE